MADAPALAPGPLASLSMLGAAESAGGPMPVLSPVLILVLCVVAGLGTFMLLPSRREGAVRKLGGVVLIVAGLILFATLVRYADSLGQGGMSAYFWVFSFVTVFCGARVVTHPRPVYSALYFVLSVLATAGLFVLLWAEFMAAALVIIYAGAILVTYVFVIMLASQSVSTDGDVMPGASGAAAGGAEYDRVSREPLVASAIGFALMGVLLFVIFDKAPAGPLAMAPAPATRPAPLAAAAPVTAATAPAMAATTMPAGPAISAAPALPPPPVFTPGSPQALGMYLFKTQFVNLELAGVILTIAMVGAILIARRRIAIAAPAAGDAARPPGPDPGRSVDASPASIPIYGTDNPRAKAYPET